MCAKDAQGHELVESGHAVCQAYIAAVIDYHNTMQSMDLAPDIKICIPEGTSLNELHDVVLSYLEFNPQHDNFVAAHAVAIALYEAFPCH